MVPKLSKILSDVISALRSTMRRLCCLREPPPPTNCNHWRHHLGEWTMVEFDFLVTGRNIVAKGKTIERW